MAKNSYLVNRNPAIKLLRRVPVKQPHRKRFPFIFSVTSQAPTATFKQQRFTIKDVTFSLTGVKSLLVQRLIATYSSCTIR
ncbi:hypothetical protein L3X07_08695 [Levilactobacillus brevis]|nr:hypothetical protein [Levilactobacillus brevis]